MEYTFLLNCVELGNLSNLPPGDAPVWSSLDVGPNAELSRGLVSRLGGSVLRCLPGDGNRSPVRKRVRMRVGRQRFERGGKSGCVYARLGRSLFAGYRVA